MIVCSLPSIKFGELSKKEVINTFDGHRLGYVCDVEIDVICGKICTLFVPKPHGLFQKPQYHLIKWDQIERISSDMILVRVPPSHK